MVTGASSSTAKGFVSPPVSSSSAATCPRSNSSDSIASRSLSRLLAGCRFHRIRLTSADSAMATNSALSGMFSPKNRSARITASD